MGKWNKYQESFWVEFSFKSAVRIQKTLMSDLLMGSPVDTYIVKVGGKRDIKWGWKEERGNENVLHPDEIQSQGQGK